MQKPNSTAFSFPFRALILPVIVAILLLTTQISRAQAPYFFFNLAGNSGSAGTNDLTGPAARFTTPSGVAVDASGNVYVADTANHTIRKISIGAAVTTLAGTPKSNGVANGAAASAQFDFPTGVAVDNSGTVYVADWGNHMIRKIRLGQVTTLAGLAGKPGWADGSNSIAQFNHPAALAFDSLNNLYVADQGNDAIRLVTPNGDVFTLAGLPGVPGSADGDGTNAQFNLPAGIGYYGPGTLIVADTGNDTIREVSLSGEQWVVKTLAGSPGLTGTNDLPGPSARFNNPMGIATGGGYIAVSDFANSTVRFVTLAGDVTTQAGSPGTSGSATGPGFSALFDFPAGIAFDASTNMYIADSGNDVIREGSPVIAPIIVTQPDSQTSVPDGSANYSVVAIGVPPLTFQWQYNGQDLANAVYSSVEIDGLQPGDNGTITVEVTSPYGSVTSSNASLTTAQPDSFITWAGSPTNAFGFADGAGSDALFSYPGALASDTNGNIFVADSYNCVIRKIVPSGLTDCTVTTIAGDPENADFANGTGTNAMFDTPYGIWVDTNENIFVADTYNYIIRQMTYDGTNWNVTTLAGTPEVQGTNDGAGAGGLFALPVGLTMGLGGNLFVSDAGYGAFNNYELRQVTLEGGVSTLKGSELISGGEFAGEGTYGLSSPQGLTADAAGNLYVADDNNNQIFEVSTNAANSDWSAFNFAGVQSDYGGTNDGDAGSAARFNQPYDVSGDTNGNYYVADTGNNTIRKISSHTVTTIGGIPGVAGSEDGVGTNALFNTPIGIVVDPKGIVYVADSGNNTIRKLLPDLLIAVQPQSQSVHVNSNATFNVVAASTSNLTYQWLKNGNPITDQNDDSLTINGAETSDAASYSVIVSSDSGSVTSSVAKLTVQIPPTVVTNPVPEVVTNGAKVTLFVAVIGTGPLTYQWLLNGVPIPGQTKTNLVVSGVSADNLGNYSLLVNGPAGDIVSANALLSVKSVTNAPPQIGSAKRSGNSITFTFISTANQMYQIQAKAALTQSSWTDLGSEITATSTNTAVSDALTNSERFYRVVLLP
ncbi:MAG TPA: immunoglobulin domain-containing protein [Verrucomicrobiae bacterium]|jgi:sugar lactone lactonase YvrE|nr:immunoglobulin domain-containing protein [Verrucomicrobiae bacterium]